jgi:hypothetical protein
LEIECKETENNNGTDDARDHDISCRRVVFKSAYSSSLRGLLHVRSLVDVASIQRTDVGMVQLQLCMRAQGAAVISRRHLGF